MSIGFYEYFLYTKILRTERQDPKKIFIVTMRECGDSATTTKDDITVS